MPQEEYAFIFTADTSQVLRELERLKFGANSLAAGVKADLLDVASGIRSGVRNGPADNPFFSVDASGRARLELEAIGRAANTAAAQVKAMQRAFAEVGRSKTLEFVGLPARNDVNNAISTGLAAIEQAKADAVRAGIGQGSQLNRAGFTQAGGRIGSHEQVLVDRYVEALKTQAGQQLIHEVADHRPRARALKDIDRARNVLGLPEFAGPEANIDSKLRQLRGTNLESIAAAYDQLFSIAFDFDPKSKAVKELRPVLEPVLSSDRVGAVPQTAADLRNDARVLLGEVVRAVNADAGLARSYNIQAGKPGVFGAGGAQERRAWQEHFHQVDPDPRQVALEAAREIQEVVEERRLEKNRLRREARREQKAAKALAAAEAELAKNTLFLGAVRSKAAQLALPVGSGQLVDPDAQQRAERAARLEQARQEALAAQRFPALGVPRVKSEALGGLAIPIGSSAAASAAPSVPVSLLALPSGSGERFNINEFERAQRAARIEQARQAALAARQFPALGIPRVRSAATGGLAVPLGAVPVPDSLVSRLALPPGSGERFNIDELRAQEAERARREAERLRSVRRGEAKNRARVAAEGTTGDRPLKGDTGETPAEKAARQAREKSARAEERSARSSAQSAARKERLLRHEVLSLRREVHGADRAAQLADVNNLSTAKLNAEAQVLRAERNRRLRRQVQSEQGLGGGAGGGGVGGGGPDRGAGGEFEGRNNRNLLSRLQLGRRFATTVGFAASSAVLYGGVSAIRTLITDAEELEAQLNILESQYNALDIAGELPNAKASIFEISRETGISTAQSAELAVQFTGAFRDAEGAATDVAFEAQRIASEIAQIAELAPTEIFNDLVPSARAFATDETAEGQLEALERLGDLTLQARNLSGVPAKELLDFLGRVGPVAKTAGLEIERLNAVAAALLQGSAVGGAGLGEQFGRILTEFGSTSRTLIDAIQGTPAFAGAFSDLDGTLSELAAGDATALFGILEAFKEFERVDPQGARDFITEIGGRREGATLSALFQNAAVALDVYAASSDAAGTRQDEFERKTETLRLQFQQFTAQLEQFGLEFFDAGLKDALGVLLESAELLLDVFGPLARAFADFNEATHGLPVQLLTIAAAVKAVTVAMAALQGTALFGRTAPTAAVGRGGLAGFLGLHIGRQYALPRGQIGPPTPPAQQGRRGIFGAPGGLGTALSVGGAVLAVSELQQTISNQRSVAQAQINGFEELVKQRTAEGFSDYEIRQRISDLGSPSTVERIGNFFRGTKSAASEALNAQQRSEAERFRSDRAESLLTLDDNQLLSLVQSDDEVLNYVLDDLEEATNRKFTSEGVDRLDELYSTADVGGVAQRTRRLVEGYLEDPANNDFDRFENLIGRLAEGSELSYVADALVDYLGERSRDTKVTDALARLADEERPQSLEQAISLYNSNEITYTEVTATLEAEIAQLDKDIALFRGEKNFDIVAQIFEEKLALQGTLAELFAARVTPTFEFEDLLADISGESSADNQTRLLERLRGLQSDPDATPEVRGAVLESVLKAQQETAKEYVDSAETQAEAIRRFEQGFVLDDSVREELASQLLSLPQTTDAIAVVADDIGFTVEQITSAMELELLGFAGAADKVLGAIDEARERLRRFEENPGLLYGSIRAREAAAEEAGASVSAYDIVEAALAEDIPTTGRLSPDSDPREKSSTDDAQAEYEAAQLALLDIDAARADGDAVELARIAQRRASLAESFAKTDAEKFKAQADLIKANEELDDALFGQASAERDLVVAEHGDDPVYAAYAGLVDANRAVDDASGPTARAEALAAQIRARRAMSDAIRDAFNAQLDLLSAVAEQEGDAVKVAEFGVDSAQRALNDGIKNGLTADQLAPLRADLIRAETGVRDAILSEEQQLINFQLEMGQITSQQAIASLQALLAIPEINEKQFQAITLEIKRLRDAAGQDFQFNLPTQLGLPTVYEVRRLNQSGAGGQVGASGYNDNRQITVNVTANTNADPNQIATAVADAVGDPKRYGTVDRRY